MASHDGRATMTETLTLETIRTDGGTQPRAYLNELVVSEYVEAMADGIDFPPVAVFYNGSNDWLADGFHRFFAAKQHGTLVMSADVHQGTRREAILHAAGANVPHGLRRTNADQWRAVRRLRQDEEWQCWSDREIARPCGVTHSFVGKLRKPLLSKNQDKGQWTYWTQHGTGATMDTTSMGRTESDRHQGGPETPLRDTVEAMSGAQSEDDVKRRPPLLPREVLTSSVPVAAPLTGGEPAGPAASRDTDTAVAHAGIHAVGNTPAPPTPLPLRLRPQQDKKSRLEEMAAASRQTPAEWMADLLPHWLLDIGNQYNGVTLAIVQQATERLVTLYQQARQEIGTYETAEAADTSRQ
ncbi:hypothetical protein NKDENANG_01169 [Candidatus Entotheonellaceae bacterium PAL068K]